MTHDIQEIWHLKQKPTGPLVPYLEDYSNYLVKQQYRQKCIPPKIRAIAKFSQWLHLRNISVNNVTHEHIQQFFQGKNYKNALKSGKVSALKQFIDFLQEIKICPTIKQSIKQTPIQQVIDSFRQYLLDEKGLSNRTFEQYKPTITIFLTRCFGKEAVNLFALTGQDVVSFVQHQATHLAIARMKVTTNALRSFLRYAVYHDDINASMPDSVPTVASWSMTDIPKAISQEQIQAVLDSCDRNTLIGKRDYAIFMLLVHLGLRSGEIVSLTLDSINWDLGSILIVGKGGHITELPLPEEVGKAIVDYLQNGRPECRDRALFLRVLAPIRSLGAPQTIGTIVYAAVNRARIDTPTHGSHQFRHALASNMLRKGASLSEIGTILRHQHSKTTNIYAKVDLIALKSLSMPWPTGGAQ
ncbi:MAG: tyrosine-type recombinase/integrase [Gammaproteobacteria bacterium]|nr:tyrosine-type recombinase/integrase [Gammaproteobacteria bacterium]